MRQQQPHGGVAASSGSRRAAAAARAKAGQSGPKRTGPNPYLTALEQTPKINLRELNQKAVPKRCASNTSSCAPCGSAAG